MQENPENIYCRVDEHMSAFLLGYLRSAVEWALAHPDESFLRVRLAEVQAWQAEHKRGECMGQTQQPPRIGREVNSS